MSALPTRIDGGTVVPSGMRDLTLVVPTFNRPDYLAQLLRYYGARPNGLEIVVLDSSEPATRARNAAEAAAVGFRHQAFVPSVPVAEKLAQGLALVETPYSAFCADDDIMFVAGLQAALVHLKANADLACVDGIYLNFAPGESGIDIKLEYAGKGVRAVHPCARVFRLFQNYQSLFYGVFRTPQLLRIVEGVGRLGSLHFQELFQASAALLTGNSHRLPVFYAGRRNCEPAEPGRQRWQTYYWFAEDRTEFLEHYANYREALWNFYAHGLCEVSLSPEQFAKAMDLSHAVFFAKNCPPRYFHSVLQPLWPLDPFEDIDPLADNVCDQLQGSRLQVRARKMAESSMKAFKGLFVKYSEASVRRLDRRVRRLCARPLNCLLAPQLRWLASDPDFADAFIDLCQYLAGDAPSAAVARR